MLGEVCPVEMYQSNYEFSCLLESYKKLNAKNVIEIGSLFGGTLWHWLKYAQTGGKFTVVDMMVATSDGRYKQQFECHESLWPRWAFEVGADLHIIESSSASETVVNAVHNYYADDKVDFMFIDGDHTYRGVKSDFEKYIDLVRPGGLVGFHDIAIPADHPHYGGVKRFWEEIKVKYETEEFIEVADWWGIGLLHV